MFLSSLPFRRPVAILLGSALATMLTGCGVLEDSSATQAHAMSTLTGSAHGGQQPISGATVNVMAPGLTGYGSAPTVLSTTKTNAGGGFVMPSYSCPANSGLLYLIVTGGDTGAGNNALAVEAAVLGPCSAALQASFINVTEVTTVAAAYTLAPFASISGATTSIGTSSTNLAGLNNTYAVANLLAPNSTGAAAASPNMPGVLVPPIALPQQPLNTLADILSACINTAGSTASGTPCALLQSNATYNNVTPADTFQAALNIARQPAANVSALYSLAAANAPYQPALTSAPNDFSLLIGFAGSVAYNSQTPAGSGKIAVDASGNVFTVSSNSLVRLAPGGVLTTTALSNSCSATAIAISQAGNVYVACSSNVIQQYSANGALLSTNQSADLNAPVALAFDAAGNLWVAETKALLEFDSNGAELAGSPYALSTSPTDVATGAAAIWSNPGNNSLLRIDNTSHALLSFSQTTNAASVALDHANDAWAANYYLDQNFSTYGGALELADSGAAVSPAKGYQGTYATAQPQGIALDGAGNAYTANSTQHPSGYPAVVIAFSPAGALLANSVHPYANTSTTSSPMTTTPGKPAFDASGNLWVPGPFGAGGYLTMAVGLGTPVVTPLATAVATGAVASKP